ncbi:MAG: cation:proton antiporter [Candidatus Bathyarchaeota archaeon]|nr:cation:proton antiporter [Candidatus Bathyarchaeum tardum]WGM90137.1 MAG: cation:proton antiporter [Candidatus Bathyarchaeum tardum]
MEYYLIFLLWIAAAFFFPRLLRRIHIPWVTAVILAGIVMGPYVLGLINPNVLMEFLATLGLILLMFSAGADTKMSVLKSAGKDVIYFTLLNMGIPMIVGFSVGFFLGLELLSAAVLSACFGSSSVAVIIPTLKELKTDARIGSLMTSSIFLADVSSLIFLAVLLKPLVDMSPVPLEIFPFALLAFLVITLYFMPKLQNRLMSWCSDSDQFSSQIRTVFITVAIVAILAEFIGIHAMVGGFLAGLSLSKMLETRKHLQENLVTISYGFLIPIFLLYVGMTTNITTLFNPGDAILTLLIITALITSKTVSGFIGGHLLGFSKRTSVGMGLMTTAQLSTTLATATVATQYGIFSDDLLTAIVVLSIVTIIISPILTKAILKQKTNEDVLA